MAPKYFFMIDVSTKSETLLRQDMNELIISDQFNLTFDCQIHLYNFNKKLKQVQMYVLKDDNEYIYMENIYLIYKILKIVLLHSQIFISQTSIKKQQIYGSIENILKINLQLGFQFNNPHILINQRIKYFREQQEIIIVVTQKKIYFDLKFKLCIFVHPFLQFLLVL
ncbi:unnamed protein product [Paramecium sonneborni]|uniref:Uncharacterized protein n=1 Tax=Paramecium sonneborni TaxID=65129 RepID=A0A8S1P0J6_9CILI|nr:unnamed protein product [Paramecium sonneborni]